MQYNAVDTFLQEAEELLSGIEQDALSLGAGEANQETINQLFRAFHTIKGSGAMFGFDIVAAFTHHIENLLDCIREGSLPVTENLADVVLKAKDHIRVLLASDNPAELHNESETLIAAIEAIAKGNPKARESKTAAVVAPAEA